MKKKDKFTQTNKKSQLKVGGWDFIMAKSKERKKFNLKNEKEKNPIGMLEPTTYYFYYY